MKTIAKKPFTALFLLAVTWQLVASSVLASDPQLGYQKVPQDATTDSVTKTAGSIAQQGECALRQVELFKKQAEGFGQQADSAIKQAHIAFISVTDWLTVQVDWAGKQLQALSRASDK